LTPSTTGLPRSGLRRTAGALAITTLLAVGAVGALPAAPARADSVEAARDRVNDLQSLARDTTAKLTTGTALWEADQKRLHTYQVELANTQRHISAAQAQVDTAQHDLGAMASALYRNHGTSGLQLAFTVPQSEFLQTARAWHTVERINGGRTQIVARAETARHRLRTQELLAQQQVKESTALAAASARRLAELNSLADRTSTRLAAAQSALEKAITARAQAATRAALAARAARDRAAQQSAARRQTRTFSGAASCSGASTSGQANGNLDPSSLCPLWQAPGHRLRADAAKAFNAMSRYHAQTQGSPLCVTDSYRSYSEQVSVYHRKPGLAAVPGTSNHGWGLAVDFCGGIQSSGSSAYRWMEANAGRFGFLHPDWARPGGSRPEAWHWEWGS
jgi:hypothetical protein